MCVSYLTVCELECLLTLLCSCSSGQECASVAPEQCLRVDTSHLSGSVNEDAGGVSLLLFNVLQVVLHLVHRAANREGVG